MFDKKTVLCKIIKQEIKLNLIFNDYLELLFVTNSICVNHLYICAFIHFMIVCIKNVLQILIEIHF